MNLSARIARLENVAGRGQENVTGIDICFVEAVQGDDGMMRPGLCIAGLRIRSGEKQQWLDADMKSVADPA